jgi:hypothetical protein
MGSYSEIISKEQQQQFIVLSILVLAIFGFTVVLYLDDPLVFQFYFGKINPLAVVSVISVLGFSLLTYLLLKSEFEIYKGVNLRGLALSVIIATLMAIIIIIVDLNFRFPENLNVLFPQSLLFYPVMGFVVEILFHLVPLSFFLFFLTPLFKRINYEKSIWLGIFFISLLEPIYQVLVGFSPENSFWIEGYGNGIHVFLFNFLQLSIFKRYDFLTMFLFRMVYYLLWHIIWGYIRLGLLF